MIEVFTTILAFILGLIATGIVSRREEIKKRKRLKDFYLSWIGFSLESLDRQVVLLKDHISELETTEISKLKFNNNQIEKLNDINNEELFDAFVISNKGVAKLNSDNLHKLGGQIEFLNIALKNIKEKFYDFRIDGKEWNKEWNNSFTEFRDLIMDYGAAQKNNMGKNIDEIWELKERLNSLDPNDPLLSQKVLKEFITPVRLVFAHHLNLDHDPIAMKGIKVSETLNTLRFKKVYLCKSYIENMKEYCGQLEYTIIKIREILEYFKNQR